MDMSYLPYISILYTARRVVESIEMSNAQRVIHSEIATTQRAEWVLRNNIRIKRRMLAGGKYEPPKQVHRIYGKVL